MSEPLPPINWKEYWEMLDNYYPLSQHSVEYYRHQNTLLKASGKRKAKKNKKSFKSHYKNSAFAGIGR